jgi:hypothetical protein
MRIASNRRTKTQFGWAALIVIGFSMIAVVLVESLWTLKRRLFSRWKAAPR